MKTNLDLTILDTILKQIEPIAQEHIPNILDQYKEIVSEKLGNSTPNIMMYGMYSNGKSTLINALVGKEVAVMAKPPTTSACDKYEWKNGGCALIDSPGIEAMKEHSITALAKREQCELVAVVAESSSFEQIKVWEAIVELVMANQKVCLIINDFDNILDNHEKLSTTVDTFRIRLQRVAQKLAYPQPESIIQHVKIAVVNAKRALKGRTEQKQKLVELSNIKNVEILFEELINSFNADDTVNILKRKLHEVITQCKYVLAQKEGHILLAEAEENLSNILLEKEHVLMDIENTLSIAVSSTTGKLRQVFNSGNTEQSYIENALSNIVENVGVEISEVVKKRLEKAEKNILGFCNDFKNFQIQAKIEVPTNDADSINSTNFNVLNLDWTSLLKHMNWEDTVKLGIESILKTVKNWLPELMVGKGPVWIANMATSTSKFLSGAASVLGVLWTLYSEYKAQQEAQDAAIRKAEAIADSIRDIQSNMKKMFMDQLTEGVDSIFDKIIPPIEKSVSDLRKQSNSENSQNTALLQADTMLGF